MKRIGITATREGLTQAQRDVLRRRFMKGPVEVHHGDCKGGDEQAHCIALAAGCCVVIHPPIWDTYRAHCSGALLVREPLPYLVRNHEIVRETEALIALPGNETGEGQRSGTWATVRYARELGRPIAIIRPSGRVEAEVTHAYGL